MKRFTSASLAIASAWLLGVPAHAARPHYGGTLRLQTLGTIRTLDPAAPAADAAERIVRERTLPLAFETLVSIDPAGGLRPALAAAWQSDANGARWRFRLRAGVKLHDGSVLEAWHVASALRVVEPSWKVGAAGEEVTIDLDSPQPDLPWELARQRRAVVVRRQGSDAIGSGAFRVDRLEGRRLTLRAHDGYWAGRPFVDAIDIEMGHPVAEQLTGLEAGRVDVATVQPTDVRRLTQRGLRTVSSRPLDLVALVFEPHRAQPSDDAIRRAVAVSIDRPAVCAVLLQSFGEPATTLLPRWLSAGAALAQADNRQSARGAIAGLPLDQRTITLRVDASDPLAQAIAERLAVDAREVGLTMTVQAPVGLAPRPDARLLRVPLEATTPNRALAGVMAALGPRVATLPATVAPLTATSGIDAVYRADRALVQQDVVVPVVHLMDVYGVGDRVEFWRAPGVLPSGAWDLANVWLRPDKPEPR